MYKYYRNKCVIRSPSEQRKIWGMPREKHATVSIITHKVNDFTAVDNYLADCEEQFQVDYIKQMRYPTEQSWNSVMTLLNTEFNRRGKNIVLECLQFGGNKEFWKQRGGLISYSNLQEDFYTEVSKRYGAKRGG